MGMKKTQERKLEELQIFIVKELDNIIFEFFFQNADRYKKASRKIQEVKIKILEKISTDFT